MTYSEIKTLALQYADRKDQEIIGAMDRLLRIVEDRYNKTPNVRKSSARASLTTLDGQEYYCLPLDFSGLRDIEIRATQASASRKTLVYLPPERMNALSSHRTLQTIGYTIIADQVQLMPPQDNAILEIIYYQSLPPLGPTNQTNWLSEQSPSIYVFGLLVEISSFVKDAEAKAAWDERFKEEISMLVQNDQDERWSGPVLQVGLG